jgi:hypothetical protein
MDKVKDLENGAVEIHWGSLNFNQETDDRAPTIMYVPGNTGDTGGGMGK